MARTASERPNAVITGTTHGIGLVTANELTRAGCRTLMLVRDPARGRQVGDAIRARVPGAEVDVVACDLSSLASVRDAAAQVQARVGAVDILINNAGIVSLRRRRSVDGFELVFATNHLGPFLLTELLLPIVAPGGRIVNVASRDHYRGTLDLAAARDPDSAPYRPRAAYARSKLANVLHAFALARRLAGREIAVNCLHPGVVRTNLLPAWLAAIKPWVSPGMIDATQGARTTLYLALDPAASKISGAYFDEHQAVRPASRVAGDLALQEALWSASRSWTGLAN